MANEYQYGDKVVFKDEFGKQVVATIATTCANEVEGNLGIDTGSYGLYVRNPEEVRHAAHHEVHTAEFRGGHLS